MYGIYKAVAVHHGRYLYGSIMPTLRTCRLRLSAFVPEVITIVQERRGRRREGEDEGLARRDGEKYPIEIQVRIDHLQSGKCLVNEVVPLYVAGSKR